MKKILLFLLLPVLIYAQSTPSGWTTNYGYRLYAQGANPGADSLNQNLIDIDADIKVAVDSAQSKIDRFTNQSIVSGTKSLTGSVLNINGGRIVFGNSTLTTPLFIGEILPTVSRTYLTYTNPAGTDTLSTQQWVRGYTSVDTSYYSLYVSTNKATTDSTDAATLTLFNVTSIGDYDSDPIKFAYTKLPGDIRMIMYYEASADKQNAGTTPEFSITLNKSGGGLTATDTSFTTSLEPRSLSLSVTGLTNFTAYTFFVRMIARLDGDGIEGGQYIRMRYPTVLIKRY